MLTAILVLGITKNLLQRDGSYPHYSAVGPNRSKRRAMHHYNFTVLVGMLAWIYLCLINHRRGWLLESPVLDSCESNIPSLAHAAILPTTLPWFFLVRGRYALMDPQGDRNGPQLNLIIINFHCGSFLITVHHLPRFGLAANPASRINPTEAFQLFIRQSIFITLHLQQSFSPLQQKLFITLHLQRSFLTTLHLQQAILTSPP